MLSPIDASAVVLGLYDIAGATDGDAASLSASSVDPAVSFSSLTRSGSLVADSDWNEVDHMFEAGNWTANASRSPTDYLQFSFSVASGYTVTPSSLTFGVFQEYVAGGNFVGPNKWDVLYSLDGFATAGSELSVGNTITGSGTSVLRQASFSPSLSGLGTLAEGTTVTLRFYAYNRTGSQAFSAGGFGNGTGDVGAWLYTWEGTGANVVLNGSAAAVPEPHEYALVFGLGLAGFAAYRRFALKAA